MFRRILQYLRPLFRPREWFKLSGRLLHWSPEAIIAFTFTIVLMVVVIVLVAWSRDDASKAFSVYLRDAFVALILVPVGGAIVYILARLCFQEPYEVFDDIERDWSSGMAELQRKGLDIRRIPLYLVLGGESNDQVHRLFKASGVEFSIVQHPAGRSSLSWYANQDAVFITCNEVGILSDLGRQAVERLLESRVIVTPQGPEPKVDLAATCWPTDEPAEESAPAAAGPATVTPAAVDIDPLGATAQINDEIVGKIERKLERNLQLGGDRTERDTARLEHLCRLIARERAPYAPINGMMTLIPINVILGDSSDGNVIRDAVRGDVTTSIRLLRLRFPVAAVVNGWEDDAGFQELIRRLPQQLLAVHRFGKGAKVGHVPAPDYLEAICHHVCKAFEDWIYGHCFKQPDTLRKTNNRLLYDLLCKVRRYLRVRLVHILAEGYDCGKKNEHLHDVGFLLGCYMVAWGRDAARRAFVPKTFERLFEKNKDLEWTPAAQRADRYNYAWAYSCFAATLGLVIVTIILLIFPEAFR